MAQQQQQPDLVLWGHSLSDYKEMFALSESDLQAKILECCGGPDSFNAELTQQNGNIISCDPIYASSKEQLSEQIKQQFSLMQQQVKKHQQRFVWDKVSSPELLIKAREKNLKLLMDDYDAGLKQHRYCECKLPNLAFNDVSFDLALCSHYLFSNCSDQSLEYHLQAITELARVAREVRIFPLLNSLGETSELVGPLSQALLQHDYGVEIKAVPYELQKKGNAMLRVWSQSCDVEVK